MNSVWKAAFANDRQVSDTYKSIRYLLLFLLFSTLLSAQNQLSQELDFQTTNTSIEDALLELSEAAGISILFQSNLFSENQMLSIQATNQSLESILNDCLADTDVTYKVENGAILLFKKRIEKFTISGFIEDAESGERLFAATIIDLISGKGTTSNEYGFFSLKLTAGACDLQCNYLGYQVDNQKFTLKNNRRLKIKLQPAFTLSEVIITPDSTNSSASQLLLGKGTAITASSIQEMPPLAGESDILRSIQLEMGVQNGVDGVGGIHIRGGESDQNLVLMDGVPVYNPSHTFGLFSVFNTPVVKSARLVKDGFSSRYGGRLSSVLDVRTKEGNNQHFSGEGEFSTLATKVLVEGPIIKDKVGFLFAARRSHIDPVIQGVTSYQRFLDFAYGRTNYNFYDLNAKVHARLSKNDQVFLSLYNGRDNYTDFYGFEDIFENNDSTIYNTNQSINWGNSITAFRWNHVYDERLFSNTTLTFSQFAYRSENYWDFFEKTDGLLIDDQVYYTRFQSIMQDIGAKMDFDFFPNERHHLFFGGGYLRRNFEPGLIEIQDSSIILGHDYSAYQSTVDEFFAPLSVQANEYNLYGEHQFFANEKWAFLTGFHAAFFQTDEAFYPSIQPRVSIQFSPNSTFTSRLSASQMTQFLHILSTSGSGLPNDMWVPSTANVRPQEAWQISSEFILDLPKNWQAKTAIFYKQLQHLTRYKTAADVPSLFEPDPLYWEEDITTGEGENYGIEAQIAKKTGNTTTALTYNWTNATRKFEGINDEKSFPFRFAHTHQINFHLRHQFSKSLYISGLFEFGSGLPYTLTRSEYLLVPLDNLSPAPEEVIGSINGNRFAPYHRFDINVEWYIEKERWEHRFLLGLYNAYNRRNVYAAYYYEDIDFPEFSGLEEQVALPILPTLGYRIRFGRN